jgi:hypothetical protein
MMSIIEKQVLPCFIFFSLTLYCSYIGDDDVAYRYMGRKPTPKETISRIRFVLAKAVASIYMGSVIAILLGLEIIKETLGFSISENQSVYLIVACICIANLFIGVIQNWIRRSRGRQQRPLIDVALWKYNLHQWVNY